MHNPSFDTVQVGDELPPLQLPSVDRRMLALFAGASGDHNPIHIDLISRAAPAGLMSSPRACWAWPGWAAC